MTAPDPYRAPLTALDTQLDLLDWWHSPRADGWRAGVRAKMMTTTGWAAGTDTVLATIPASLGGWTCWVGGDAAELVGEAALTVPPPDGAIGPGTMPQPAGMIWLAGDPLDFGIVADDRTGWIRAFSWAPMLIPSRDGTAPAVAVIPWLEREPGDPPRPAPAGALPLSAEAAGMLDDPGDATTTYPMADLWDEGTVNSACYRWILAAWVMCGQVLPQRIESAPRPLRRRAHRRIRDMPPDWGEVHVTTLRQIPRGSGGESGDPAYHHRWIVSGHWRWQACGKGRADRKLIWIAPHVKGPEDAPLIEVEQVAKLVR